jgi:hypothetical protein
MPPALFRRARAGPTIELTHAKQKEPTTMTAIISTTHSRYARAIASSKRARWDIDADVIRGRAFDRTQKFLPDGLSLAAELAFLTDEERVFLSQVQGRTYANIFGLVERFIDAKVLEVSAHHFFGDQTALEALVRFSDEELKHQELFRRVEALAAKVMPDGYGFPADPNDVARAVLQSSTWSVLALTCLVELFTQVHFKESIERDARLSPLFKDVFRFHWMEESQHAILDELEWAAEDERLGPEARDRAVTDLIHLVSAVDGILRTQSDADSSYFMARAGRAFSSPEQDALRAMFLRAYRHQYILSGVQSTRFTEILRGFISDTQFERVAQALATLQ